MMGRSSSQPCHFLAMMCAGVGRHSGVGMIFTTAHARHGKYTDNDDFDIRLLYLCSFGFAQVTIGRFQSVMKSICRFLYIEKEDGLSLESREVRYCNC